MYDATLGRDRPQTEDLSPTGDLSLSSEVDLDALSMLSGLNDGAQESTGNKEVTNGADMVYPIIRGDVLPYYTAVQYQGETKQMIGEEMTGSSGGKVDLLFEYLASGYTQANDLVSTLSRYPELKQEMFKTLGQLRVALLEYGEESAKNTGSVRVSTDKGVFLFEIGDIKDTISHIEGDFVNLMGVEEAQGGLSMKNKGEVRVVDQHEARRQVRAVPLDTLLAHGRALNEVRNDPGATGVKREISDLNKLIGFGRYNKILEKGEGGDLSSGYIKELFGDLTQEEVFNLSRIPHILSSEENRRVTEYEEALSIQLSQLVPQFREGVPNYEGVPGDSEEIAFVNPMNEEPEFEIDPLDTPVEGEDIDQKLPFGHPRMVKDYSNPVVRYYSNSGTVGPEPVGLSGPEIVEVLNTLHNNKEWIKENMDVRATQKQLDDIEAGIKKLRELYHKLPKSQPK